MSKSIKNLGVSAENKETVEMIPRKGTGKGKTTRQIMTKHIQDKNDVITDEDFKNLNIDLEVSKDTAHQPLEIPDDSQRPKDEDKDPKIVTPWDVIN
jgi:hypothetical protein